MIEKAGSPLRVRRDKVDTLFASNLQLGDCNVHAAGPVCGMDDGKSERREM